MRTVIDLPPGWSAHDDGTRIAPPHGTLAVEVTAPQPKPLDPATFVRDLVARVEPDLQARTLGTRSGTTACGWPFDRLDCVVADAAGKAVEGRQLVILHLLGWVAVLTVRCRDKQELARWQDTVDAIVASARPDWRGAELAALAEAWG